MGTKCNFCGSQKKVFSLMAVNDTDGRAVKRMQDFRGKVMAN